uniref:Uncharacterized protein n=1 Tax=Oryza nivara TaxID=4536 RepID=A0A0E0FI97_ORYNI
MSETDLSPAAAAEGRKPRRLRGHRKGAVTCCVASSSRPGVVASSGEDGCLCWFDLRTKDVLFTMEATNQPISSMCFKAVSEEGILGGSYKVCAVARGDGAVDVVDLEYELAPAKSKGLPRMADLSLSSKGTDIGDGCGSQSQGKRIHLDYTVGHTSSVSCVQVPLCCFSVISDISYPFTNRLILYNSTFSAFGEKGKFLISGGNDSSVKLWGSHSLRI